MKEITQKSGTTFLYKGKEAKIFACDEVYAALENGWTDAPGVIDVPKEEEKKDKEKSGSKKQDK